MIKNIVGGICVGVANIIPGVSGGTIIVLLSLFDDLMESISNIFNFKMKLKDKKKGFLFIVQFMLGAGIGLVGFAKILEFLFVKFEIQTLYWFVGLIICSLPMLKKKELNNEKINWIFVLVGIFIIWLISYLAPGEEGNIVPLEQLLSKEITFVYCLTLVGIGVIGGASMMFPGVSGSMLLLILGYYHLFKGYIANITTFELNILIPLVFMAIGMGVGIIVSAVITNYLLKNYKRNIVSLIFGLIIMSAITIIPTSGYAFINSITSVVAFLFGALVIYIFDKYQK